MLKIGITGQAGFIGTHLYNKLALTSEKYTLIPFKNEYFMTNVKLETFVQQCDVIVHLAAMNRHNDPQVIYQTNIDLVNQLIQALEDTNSTPHVLFASSTQEECDNQYGQSKKVGRLLLEQWAKKNKAWFTGLIIPNAFGPFGNPYYNSVVATFCHQLTHGEQPQVEIDAELKLIYVGELVSQFINSIGIQDTENVTDVETILVPYTTRIKVSKLLSLIVNFKIDYFEKGIFPNLTDKFTKNLFFTFICYIDHSKWFPFYLNLHTDNRGSFVETAKLKSGGQIAFSTTAPGITRGNHYHTRKVERFAVIKGQAKIEIRRIGTDFKQSFLLNGDRPSFVDMPIWFTHNITNIGDDDLYTIFWINEQ
ncbi:MAG: polysaccharide biosynthesis C-terminal domain-containing protein, partial [Fidelibacterota bacterium]